MVEGRPEIADVDVNDWAAKFGLCSKKGEGHELASVKKLDSYDDLNFRIKTADGKEYVLKAHNGFLAAGSYARLEAQDRMIERLASKGLPVNAVVRTPDGKSIVSMSAPGAPLANQKAHVRVLTYVQGHIVPNETAKTPGFFNAIGALVGRVTKALEGFEDEGAKWDWDWNMKNVASVCASKVQYLSEARRLLAHQFIGSYASALSKEAMSKVPHSVIHADLNDTNLLFDAPGGEKVVGVLDFGDSIYSCTVFDLGIAAGYYSLGQEDPLMVFCECLRGFLQESDLNEDELALLYHVAYGRVLLSVCMSAEGISKEPDNEYLAHTSEPGWAVLNKLSGVTAEGALVRFRTVRDQVESENHENKRRRLEKPQDV